MKCVLLSPFLRTQRGNSITVIRLENALLSNGIEARSYGFCETAINPIDFAGADIIHAFHAYYFGRDILPYLSSNVPVVLTMTGTDYNIDLYDSTRRKIVITAIRRADKIVVFHAQAKSQILSAIPESADKISVIPPGIEVNGILLRKNMLENIAKPLILIVAGLRRVKNVILAINAVNEVNKYKSATLVHIGPVLEDDIAKDIQKAAAKYPWFYTLGEVPHQYMADIYKHASIVLNTSLSEAIPNSILEAMCLNRPVVVSNTAGNLAVVKHNETGLVYTSKEELIAYLLALLNDDALSRRLGQAAGAFVREHFDAGKEAAGYICLYRELIATRKRG